MSGPRTPGGASGQGKASALQLRPVFQPICAPNGRPYAYEALMRLDGLAASPFPFIRRWERTGCIPVVDLAMLASVLDAIERADPRPMVAVNVSIATIEAEHGGDAYAQALDKLARALPGLIVELTETALIRNDAAVVAFASWCKARGIAVALDDCRPGHVFGTAAFLNRLRPDFVKIDGGFVRLAFDQAEAAQAMRDLIDTAHQLGARVVAEHISSSALQAFAVGLGVDFVQGFALGVPAMLPGNLADPERHQDKTPEIKDNPAIDKRDYKTDEARND